MSDEQLARTYTLEPSEAEHARLIAVARRDADQVREMCARAGVGEGARVVDVGCGPVGALLELAEIVGSQGTVVGVDSSVGAIETARGIVARSGRRNVRLVHGDVYAMAPAALEGDRPFDAAHLRFVLIHLADPAPALRRVAGLLRPGGHVLVHDYVEDARFPRYDPPVPASERAFDLLTATRHRRGAAADVGRRLPRLCEEAGLRVLDARGVFSVQRPARDWLEDTRRLLLSARRDIVGFGLATDADIDALVEALAAAAGQEFRSALGYLFVQVIARVP
jgi:SAM-dependent methyltransferase